MAGERDPVDVERLEVERPVRRVLGGVEQHPGAVPAGDGGEPLDRPELAGDVGRGGEHDERLARAAGGAGGQGAQGGLEQGLGVAGAGGHGQAHGVAAAPGQQGRVVLGGEDDHRGVAGQRPGEQVDRVGGAAGEDDDVVLAGADEAGHLVAGGLVVGAGHPREPAGAAVHAGVGAGGGLDGPRHPQRRPGWMPRGRGWRSRPGRPTGSAPGRGAPRPAGRGPGPGRRGGGARRHPARRAAAGGGGRWGWVLRWVLTWLVIDTVGISDGPEDLGVRPRDPALADARRGRRPGRHPEHPTAEEGCWPASRGLPLALMTYAEQSRDAGRGARHRGPRPETCGERGRRRGTSRGERPASPGTFTFAGVLKPCEGEGSGIGRESCGSGGDDVDQLGRAHDDRADAVGHRRLHLRRWPGPARAGRPR